MSKVPLAVCLVWGACALVLLESKKPAHLVRVSIWRQKGVVATSVRPGIRADQCKLARSSNGLFSMLTSCSPTVAYKVAMKFLHARDAGDTKVFQFTIRCSCDRLIRLGCEQVASCGEGDVVVGGGGKWLGGAER